MPAATLGNAVGYAGGAIWTIKDDGSMSLLTATGTEKHTLPMAPDLAGQFALATVTSAGKAVVVAIPVGPPEGSRLIGLHIDA